MYQKFKKNRYQWKRNRSIYREKIQLKWNNYLLKFENNAFTSIIEKKRKEKKKKSKGKKISKLWEKFFPNGKI